jgi:ribonuclease G
MAPRSRRRHQQNHGPNAAQIESVILVNVTPWETRVAILENDRLVELLVEREHAVVGNIYKGVVENVVTGLDAAFVNCGMERNVFLHVADALHVDPLKGREGRLPKISEVVHPGQELIVQVTKGPIESKGARATVRVSLPGRYVVLMRDGHGTVGISKKVEDEEERRRLRELAQRLKPPGWGIIVRTRAQGAGHRELQSDVRFLMRTWRTIEKRARQCKAPALLYEDLSLIFEVLRDVVDQRVRKMVVDHRPTYELVRRLLSQMAADLANRVELYEGQEPIFLHYGVEREIDRALRPKVWLPSGGHITIEETEALTTVDVNTGRFTGTGSLADTVLRTNIEAAEEIARQLRLRDIGGIIVIDFIDMDRRHHRDRVMEAMRNALAADRMRTRIMHITRLGLLEMTRKRTDVSLSHVMQDPCPWCQGTGRVLNATTVATRIIMDLSRLASQSKSQAFAVMTEPQVALSLIGPHGELVEAIEREHVGRPVLIRANVSCHRDHYEITPGDLHSLERQFGYLVAGDTIQIQPSQVLAIPHSSLLAIVKGIIVEVPDAPPKLTAPISARVIKATRSYARAVPASK